MKITSSTMRFVLVVTAFVPVLAVAVRAQTPVAEKNSAKETLERFCRLDAEERQLNPDGQKEVTDLLYDQKPWTEHPEITVVKDYLVRAPAIWGDIAEVVVEYNVWGQLDSTFRFVRLAGLSENHP